MKIWLIVVALGLLGCLLVLGWRVDEPHELTGAVDVPEASAGPSFEVRVVVPRLGLAAFGVLPNVLVERFRFTPRELRFDSASRGAEIGRVAPDRLELGADGWDLSIESDGEGRVTPGTRLVFATPLGGSHVTLRCRPADPAAGYLRTRAHADGGELGGTFLVELAACEDAESGREFDWPPSPLTVIGSFERLPHGTG